MSVAQLCLTLCNPMDCSLPGSSVHGNLQVRILEWLAILSSRGSSRPRAQTQVSYAAGRFFTIWATDKALWSICTCLGLLTFINKLSSRNVLLYQFSNLSAVLQRVFWPTEGFCLFVRLIRMFSKKSTKPSEMCSQQDRVSVLLHQLLCTAGLSFERLCVVHLLHIPPPTWCLQDSWDVGEVLILLRSDMRGAQPASHRLVVVLQSLSCVWLFRYSLTGSSDHGISQLRILEWIAISFSRVSFQPRDQTHISCIAGGFFTTETPLAHWF